MEIELTLERVILKGENLDETDPQCSPYGWIIPLHGSCHKTVLRETGEFGIIGVWPDERIGTVPSVVKGICPDCHQEFFGLGPL